MNPFRSLASLFIVLMVATAIASCGPKSPSSESTSTPSNYPTSSDSATMNSSARAAIDSAMHAQAVANGQRHNSLGVPATAPPPTTPGAGSTTAGTPATGGDAAAGAKSKYDDGPRASASPVNAALAAQGKTLFTNKGCVTCHAFGKKVIGPDLKGVASQRAARWIENQIMHPEVMIKEDPISKDLFAQYKVPMTNQKVTPDQAKALVEYIKQNK